MKFVLIGVCDYIISFFIGTAASDFPVVSLATVWHGGGVANLNVFMFLLQPFSRAGVQYVMDGGHVWGVCGCKRISAFL